MVNSISVIIEPKVLACLALVVVLVVNYSLNSNYPNKQRITPRLVQLRYDGEKRDVTKKYSTKRNGWGTINVFFGTLDEEDEFTKRIPPHDESQAAQSSTIALLHGTDSGYFLDLASNDALYLSNTIMLERDLDWNGLCIEANPTYWEKLSRRKCALIGAAVGHKNNAEVNFTFDGVYGGIIGFDNQDGSNADTHTLRTVELRSVLQKFNVPQQIDYWSFDVEGAEEYIASVFPWSEYRIKILTVERPSMKLQDILYNKGNLRYICDHGDFGDQLWVTESLWSEYKSKLARALEDGRLPVPSLDNNSATDWFKRNPLYGIRRNFDKCVSLNKTYLPAAMTT